MVRGRAGSPKIGLFQQGSHRIADIPHCGVHRPEINEAAAALKRAMRVVGARPYADAPHAGLVRALQAVVERGSGTLQLAVVTNSHDREPAEPMLDALQRELGAALHSLFWNGNPERTNRILGPHWEAVSGPEAVRETIGGADVFFPPAAFGQSHLELADRIVREVHAEVADGARVLEFHAGCGAIGLGLLLRGRPVAFNEVDAAGVRGLEMGLARLPQRAQDRAQVLPGAAAEHVDALSQCDVAIVDPPRKGLEGGLCEALAAGPPERLIYVSCDPQSLLRDTRQLLEGGQLRLRRLTPFALFPFSEHVETLAIFNRT
jgi:23S rRNA (uracil1939-C5)-methyltransferase